MQLDDQNVRPRFLIRDRDSKYTRHYNEHRPHRALDQRPPVAKGPPAADAGTPAEAIELQQVRRLDRLGGLIHEYHLAA